MAGDGPGQFYIVNGPGNRTAETPVASTVHEPFGSPSGPGLFHVKGLQLPAYIQHVAHHLVAQGHPESKAIQMAIGIIKNWAAGGQHVHPDVQAAAVKALAEWEAAKAAAHGKRFNPYHLGTGAGGGEFTSAASAGKGTSGGKSASAAKAPAAAKGGKAGESRAERKQRFLTQAKAARAKAHELQRELHGLETQAKQQHAKSVAAAKKAAHHQKINPHAKHQQPGHGHHHHHHRQQAKTLHQRITGLRQQIRQLLTQAASLEAQARAL